MSIPYEQSSSSEDTVPGSPSMRPPSYTSLRRQRYHPYTTTRARPLSNFTNVMEPAWGADFGADVPLARVNPIPVSFLLPAILEDDCMAGLRTVVSQMIGRDSTQMRLGTVHLVIDFALIVRSHLRKNGAAIRNKATVALPTATIGLSM